MGTAFAMATFAAPLGQAGAVSYTHLDVYKRQENDCMTISASSRVATFKIEGAGVVAVGPV